MLEKCPKCGNVVGSYNDAGQFVTRVRRGNRARVLIFNHAPETAICDACGEEWQPGKKQQTIAEEIREKCSSRRSAIPVA